MLLTKMIMCNFNHYFVLCCLFPVMFVADPITAKTCSICDSDEHPTCLESGIRARGCPESYPHCAKIVFRNDEGMDSRVVRRCTLNSAQDTCDESEHVCYYVCREDLCNASSSLRPDSALIVTIILVFVTARHFLELLMT